MGCSETLRKKMFQIPLSGSQEWEDEEWEALSEKPLSTPSLGIT
jgi:hypothetical protein